MAQIIACGSGNRSPVIHRVLPVDTRPPIPFLLIVLSVYHTAPLLRCAIPYHGRQTSTDTSGCAASEKC